MDDEKVTETTATATEQEPETGGEWREKARLWEKRATADKKRADAAEASMAELKERLAEAEKRAGEAQAEIDRARAERERAEMIAKVADKHGIDPKYRPLLTGADEKALESQAELLAERFAEPVPSDNGENRRFDSKEDELKKFAHDLFAKK